MSDMKPVEKYKILDEPSLERIRTLSVHYSKRSQLLKAKEELRELLDELEKAPNPFDFEDLVFLTDNTWSEVADRMLKESCSKAVYSKTREEKSAAEVMEDLMSMKGSDGVIVNSIKESAERTSIIIAHVDKMLDVYRVFCSKCGEKEKRQYKVVKAMYMTKEAASVPELSKRFGVSKVTIYDDIKAAEERLSALFFGINGLKFSS